MNRMKTNRWINLIAATFGFAAVSAVGSAENEKIAQAVAECKRLKVQVLPPDINKSGDEFTIEDNNTFTIYSFNIYHLH